MSPARPCKNESKVETVDYKCSTHSARYGTRVTANSNRIGTCFTGLCRRKMSVRLSVTRRYSADTAQHYSFYHQVAHHFIFAIPDRLAILRQEPTAMQGAIKKNHD